MHLVSYMYIGLKKKLTKLGKYKDCDIINDQTKSITNHLYWCAASTPENDRDEMAIRWKSLMDHIQDSHEEYYHDPLGDLERHKKWFIPGKCMVHVATFIVERSFYIYIQELKYVKTL